MIYPQFLKKGECIGVPAPSDGSYNGDELNKKRFVNAKLNLENLGYKVKLSENIFNSYKARSASAKIRAIEINEMFESKEIDTIICAAGGEFLVEILPYVDFEKIVQNPKWIQGMSDPTGLLFPITTKYDIATLYGQNFGAYGIEEKDKNIQTGLEILKGECLEEESYDLYEEERIEKVTGLEGHNYTEQVKWKVIGNKNKVEFKGRIIGGCFDIIRELSGTKYDGTKEFINRYKSDGIIWYFDNCELSKEDIIRTLWKFNELGYFQNTVAVMFGRNGVEKSCLEYTMEDCLKDSILSSLEIPIIYDADFSHKAPCMNVINGSIANVIIENGRGKLKYELY